MLVKFFFETDNNQVMAHTANEIFLTGSKLYELEKILPWYFSRISKSAILNVKKVYAITRNLTASSLIEFEGTPKHVYVSRAYYKPLKEKLEEMIICDEKTIFTGNDIYNNGCINCS